MGNISREMEILTKYQRGGGGGKLEIKNKTTVTELNNAFDGLTGRLDTGDSVILEMSKETFSGGNSPAVQWLGLNVPLQGLWVQSLVRN